MISDLDTAISRSRAKSLIDDGRIRVNDEPAKPKYHVQSGDKIVVDDVLPQPISLTPEDIPLDIVYEDNDVIVVNKPQGMVVHPSPGHPDHTLVNALLFHSPLSTINGEFRPGIVHRIDKDTSGLLMVAKMMRPTNFCHSNSKNRKAYESMSHWFMVELGKIQV